MPLIVDASVALTWCFDDEMRPETDAVGRRILEEGAIVPTLFHLEVASILLAGERRKRITREEVGRRLERIGKMPFKVDDETIARSWDTTLALARAETLTVYDAAYLELALRTRSQLASLDRNLVAAARRRRVSLAL